MISLFVIMIVSFLSYVLYIICKYGVQKSISESYYRLPDYTNLLFVLFTWGLGLPAIIIGTDLTTTPFMFIGGVGIIFVGASPAFKKELIGKVHNIGASVGIAMTHISIIFDFKMYYITGVFIIISLLILLFKVKNHIWWIEILAFLSICYVLGINLIK